MFLLCSPHKEQGLTTSRFCWTLWAKWHLEILRCIFVSATTALSGLGMGLKRTEHRQEQHVFQAINRFFIGLITWTMEAGWRPQHWFSWSLLGILPQSLWRATRKVSTGVTVFGKDDGLITTTSHPQSPKFQTASLDPTHYTGNVNEDPKTTQLLQQSFLVSGPEP